MLTRSSQIGEFYIMMPPQVKPTGTGTGLNLHTADMLIYDEESDKHVRVTWREALKATLANATNAAGERVLGERTGVSKGHSGTIELATWAAQAEAIAKYSSGVDEDGNAVDVADDAWEALQTSGALGCRIVVARPFIEHLMHNAILAVSGRETGATLFGPADSEPRVTRTPRPLPLLTRCSLCVVRSATVGEHAGQDHRGCVPRPHARAHALRLAPPAERANCGAQDTTLATSRPWSLSRRTCS